MKQLLSLFLLLAGALAANAQQQPFENGFYRAKNLLSNRWIFVRDNQSTGLNTRTTTYDVSALSTYLSWSRIVSNPGSVVYMMKSGSGYNLYAQGTDVKSFTGGMVVYLWMNPKNPSTWRLYSTAQGVSASLSDAYDPGNPYEEEGYVTTITGTSGVTNERYWNIQPLDVNSSDSYFGITPDVQVGSDYYKSFYASFAFSSHSGSVTSMYVTRITEDGAAIWQELAGKVPGGVPVVVKTSSANPSDNRLDLYFEQGGGPADNKLTGVYFCHYLDRNGFPLLSSNIHRVVTPYDPTTMRLLGVTSSGSVGFVTPTDVTYVPANSCYLAVPAGTPAELPLMTEAEYPAWQQEMTVESVKSESRVKRTGVYTLSGQRVNATGETAGLMPGVYMVNGRKTVVK